MLTVKFIKTSLIILFLSILFLPAFLFLDCKTLNAKEFNDDFDSYLDGTESLKQNWERFNDPWGAPCSANWEILNGQIGIKINQGDCSTNLIPKDSAWNNLGNNYIFEVDIKLVSGTDHNIAFRFEPSPNLQWYDIHITPPNTLVLERVPPVPPGAVFTSYPIPNDSSRFYHFKIIINTGNIKAYIDNNQIFDYSYDTLGELSPTGRIALRASTGGDPSSETWFDNVVVTSLDPEPTMTPVPTVTPEPTSTPIPTATPIQQTPVILVPGLGASINFKEMFLGQNNPDGWKMTPGATLYNNIIKAFENYGDFYVFNYDWKKPVTESAKKLYEFIRDKVKPPDNKVYLVGHSLGGLVSRTCVQTQPNDCFMEKLVTVSSPQSGSVDTYPAIEGGEVWRKGIYKLYYELLIKYFQKPGETKKETLQRIALVLKDLMPTFDYLRKNGVNLPPSALSIKNDLILSLQNFSKLVNKTKTISGRGFDSPETIILGEPNWLDKMLGNWPDGKPIDKIPTQEGDLSVLVKSSNFNHPEIENFTFNLDHSGVISDQTALQKIFDILGITLPNISYVTPIEPENFLVFFVHSPVKISLNNPPADVYLNDELIIIPNPENKTYGINVVGLKNNYYSLSIGQIFGDNVFWNDWMDKISLGENKAFNFSINPSSPSLNPLIDPDGSITKNLLYNQIEEFKSEIKALKINEIFKKSLILLLDKIQLENNFNIRTLNYLHQLRTTIGTFEKIKIIDSLSAETFRQKAKKLSVLLEFLVLKNPQNINKNEVNLLIKESEGIAKITAKNNLRKNAAMIFSDGQTKLDQAKDFFSKKNYFPAKISVLQARNLFLEANIVK